MTRAGRSAGASTLQPATQRNPLLDVVRGVAILGTLATNIWIFANPAGIIGFLEQPMITPHDVSTWAEGIFRVLANGKFLALLTILFGVGIELQRRSAEKRGQRWPGRYLWRAAILLADGILHFILVVEFDILMGYAVTSMIVAYLVLTSERAQRRWTIAMGALHVVLVTLVTLILFAEPLGAANPDALAEGTRLYAEGTWWDQVLFRLDNAAALRAEAVFILPYGVMLFLLGAALYRAGAFGADDRGRQLRRRMLIAGGIALPINMVIGLSGEPALLLVDRYLLPPFVALLYIALTAIVVDRLRAGSRLLAGVSNVGRTALSCYILQNVLGSILFYGWGFGLASTLQPYGPWPVFGIYAAMCAGLAGLSTLWLRYFQQGPFEAMWRYVYEFPWRGQAERTNRS
ncbi:DUF418 domain-containing protein [Hoyosella sp. YIM 151337]|uniref:DUF418 domain-containing protein n=1 Tax=Hoyosella sp. YIM 151337 TaxID=2992742 RepID=UPI002235F4F8|nr:DUF418 domain-containing protein [Hoyosella sp. YIM 151337]MCW4354422.1 DUF418 domain-containing protein [Hoyosella sp. YIM 151337]